MIRTKSVLTFKARLISPCSWKTLAKFGIGIASSIAITSFSTSTLALNVEQVPNPKQNNGGWVTDQANILTPATEAEINQIISDLSAKNGTEMAVVTVLSTAPSATPKEFATELFNRWGIGKKSQNNGVLLLISKGERRVEVETGYGVEDILPDAKVGNIISQKMTPQFKKGDFDKGTLAGTKALVQALETKSDSDNESAKNLSSNAPNPGVFYLHYLILGLGAAGLIIVLVNYIKVKIENPNILSDSESDRPSGQKRQVNSNSVRNSRTIHAATESKRGKRVNTDNTDTYNWYNERNKGEEGIIDRIPSTSPPSPPDKSSNWSSNDSSSHSSDSNSNSSDWGSSSSSNDYGSSSDWGCGSSGGGGAGDSW